MDFSSFIPQTHADDPYLLCMQELKDLCGDFFPIPFALLMAEKRWRRQRLLLADYSSFHPLESFSSATVPLRLHCNGTARPDFPEIGFSGQEDVIHPASLYWIVQA